MEPRTLWERYAAIWSLTSDERIGELEACLADNATYCDPNVLLSGKAELSAYMEGFRRDVPGGAFRIRTVSHHHGRSLAQWTLLGPGGNPLQNGTSFGFLAEDGRLQTITGFFHDSGPDDAQ